MISTEWYVVMVRIGREQHCLEQLAGRASGLGVTIVARLSPTKGYLLAKLPLDPELRRQVLNVRGVQGLLGGKKPVTVPEEKIKIPPRGKPP